jgi:hypothetical protein
MGGPAWRQVREARASAKSRFPLSAGCSGQDILDGFKISRKVLDFVSGVFQKLGRARSHQPGILVLCMAA